MNIKPTSMLYVSLIHLPRENSRWRHLDTYQAHQIAWKAFPGVPRGERPFLFSLDDRGTHQSLLVQSTCEPDWSFLGGDGHAETKSFDPSRIEAGTPLRFFVRANPTVDRQGFADGKKRRVAVGTNREHTAARMGIAVDEVPTRDEQLRLWLQRRGEEGGFHVESCLAGPAVARKIVRSRERRASGPPMTIHEVELTGVLRITEQPAFARICATGIGRGKAFGYGLLMVRPAA